MAVGNREPGHPSDSMRRQGGDAVRSNHGLSEIRLATARLSGMPPRETMRNSLSGTPERKAWIALPSLEVVVWKSPAVKAWKARR